MCFLAAVCQAECEFECNPHEPPCSEMLYTEVSVCSTLHAKNLKAANHNCSMFIVGDNEHVATHDTLFIIAPTLADIPSCGKRLGRSGGAAGIKEIAKRVGDLDLTDQLPFSYTDTPSFYDSYHVYDSMRRRWQDMESRSPNVTIEVIGQSFQGRDIEMLRVGHTDASAPKRIFINALQHAREWTSTMTVTYIADQLTDCTLGAPGLEGKFTDEMAEVKRMLQEVEVLIVPIVNPDGYVHTRTSRFHRKNMRTNDGSACTGVDLNRNWGKDYNGGQSNSKSPCDDIFIGEGAFSEPEAASVRDAILGNKGVLAHIDYHAYGGMILGPWSFSGTEVAPAAEKWKEFSSFLEKGMAEIRGTEYRKGLGTEPILPYSASGVMSDWSYDQGMMSATIEVHPVTGPGVNLGLSGFILNVPEMRESCQDNFGAFTGLLRYATQTTLASNSSDPNDNQNTNTTDVTNNSETDNTIGGTTTSNSNLGEDSEKNVMTYALISGGALIAVLVVVIAGFLFWRGQAASSGEETGV